MSANSGASETGAPEMALAVLGSTTRDLVDEHPARAGGAPIYAARALARLGANARVVTRCAAADSALLDAVRASGLPVLWHPVSCTPEFRIVNVPGERELSIQTLGDEWTSADATGWVSEALDEVGWLHVAPLWRGEFPAATLAVLAAGRYLCLDGQGLVRPGRLGPVRLDASFDREVLRHVRALHLAEVEARALGLETSASALGSLGVAEVIVTFSERGSVVVAEGRAETVAAKPLDAGDPTGAGDMFTAAYVACRAAGGEPVEAARAATATVRELLAEGVS